MFTTKKSTGILEDDLCQLRRRVDQMESDLKIQKLEGAELYDKTLRLMQRMAKRYAVDAKDGTVLPDAPPVNSGSESMDPISEQILLRRNRGFLAQ